MKAYRILRLTDGLYKDKGMNSSFSKEGTLWHSKGHVHNHISQNTQCDYRNCMVVEYRLELISAWDVVK